MQKTAVLLNVPEAFSSVIGMGRLIDFYPVRKSSRVGTLVFGLLLIAAALATLAYGALNTWQFVERFGPAVIVRYLPVPLAASGVMFLIGVGLLTYAFINWPKAAAVYEKGLAYYDRKGLLTWVWTDISEVYVSIIKHYTYGIHTGTTHLYTLISSRGSKLKLDNKFDRIQELGTNIQQNAIPHIYNRAAADYEANKVVKFGPVSLSKPAGIQLKNKTYGWDEVGQVTVSKGILRIVKREQRLFGGASVQVARIPNLEALLALLDGLMNVQVK